MGYKLEAAPPAWVFGPPQRLLPLLLLIPLLVLLPVLYFSTGVSSLLYPPLPIPIPAAAALPTRASYTMDPRRVELATFAAGCFWSVELAFQRVPGVLKTAVGYTQGSTVSPGYKEVCAGRTGHVEAVLVEYDPAIVSYDHLLQVYWRKCIPSPRKYYSPKSQYRNGIYHHTQAQKSAADKSLAERRGQDGDVWVEILPNQTFFMAEEYHQQYLSKQGK